MWGIGVAAAANIILYIMGGYSHFLMMRLDRKINLLERVIMRKNQERGGRLIKRVQRLSEPPRVSPEAGVFEFYAAIGVASS